MQQKMREAVERHNPQEYPYSQYENVLFKQIGNLILKLFTYATKKKILKKWKVKKKNLLIRKHWRDNIVASARDRRNGLWRLCGRSCLSHICMQNWQGAGGPASNWSYHVGQSSRWRRRVLADSTSVMRNPSLERSSLTNRYLLHCSS